MKYLFWNTHNNESINPILCDLIIENHISVVVLAEYSANIDKLTGLLQDAGAIMNPASTIGCDRIVTCNNREEVEELVLNILTSKRVLSVMQELIHVYQAQKYKEANSTEITGDAE